MKSLLWLIAGFTAYAAYHLIVKQPGRPAAVPAPVDDLAHRLQDAWADHHTVA